MYFQTIRKRFIPEPKTTHDSLVTDTIYRFANAIDGSISSSFNTRLYGMFQFKKGPVIGIRHMLIPTISFSYTPNFGAPSLGYYKRIENDTTRYPCNLIPSSSMGHIHPSMADLPVKNRGWSRSAWEITWK
jgi:hypothetical protein